MIFILFISEDAVNIVLLDQIRKVCMKSINDENVRGDLKWKLLVEEFRHQKLLASDMRLRLPEGFHKAALSYKIVIQGTADRSDLCQGFR